MIKARTNDTFQVSLFTVEPLTFNIQSFWVLLVFKCLVCNFDEEFLNGLQKNWAKMDSHSKTELNFKLLSEFGQIVHTQQFHTNFGILPKLGDMPKKG